MTGAGDIWRDKTLEEWPENDFRIFVGDLDKQVSDQDLTEVRIYKLKTVQWLFFWIFVLISRAFAEALGEQASDGDLIDRYVLVGWMLRV